MTDNTPTKKTETMAKTAVHATATPWPSEKSASSLYNVANIGLILALVCGVIATALIVWMGNVKEDWLRLALSAAHERVGLLENQAADTNAGLKNASARIATEQAATSLSDEKEKKDELLTAEAQNETERLKLQVGWRELDLKQLSRLKNELSLSPLTLKVDRQSLDPEADALCKQLVQVFLKSGFIIEPSGAFISDETFPPGISLSGPSDEIARMTAALNSVGLSISLSSEGAAPLTIKIGSKPRPAL